MSLALDAPAPIGFGEKIWRINWGLVLVLTAIAGIGVLALYSAAGGRFEPWAARHAMRYGAAFGLMLVVALIHPKVWLTLAWPIYVVSMLLLVAVDVVGKIGMGAQRWLVIGPMQIQPSEIAKVAVILVLARYYHGLRKEEAVEVPLHPAAARRDPGAGGAGHGAARPRHRDDGAAGRRRAAVRGRRAALDVPGRRHRRRRLPADRLVVHARIPAQARAHLPRSRPRSAGRGLPHHPVQDRHRLGRPVRQGVPEGHAILAELPAREADRLHLHHLRRGMGHGGRAASCSPCSPWCWSGASRSPCAASTISAAWWRSASPP